MTCSALLACGEPAKENSTAARATALALEGARNDAFRAAAKKHATETWGSVRL